MLWKNGDAGWGFFILKKKKNNKNPVKSDGPILCTAPKAYQKNTVQKQSLVKRKQLQG